jgi:hypothetical protein
VDSVDHVSARATNHVLLVLQLGDQLTDPEVQALDLVTGNSAAQLSGAVQLLLLRAQPAVRIPCPRSLRC